MTREIRTNLVINAKSQGFADVQKQVSRISETAQKGLESQVKGFGQAKSLITRFFGGNPNAPGGSRKVNPAEIRAYKQELDKLQQQLQGLAKQQLTTTRALEGVDDQAKPAYKELIEEMQRLERESSQVERKIQLLNRAYRDHAQAVGEAKRAKGAFLQGFAQGVLPEAVMLQRGPGMARQLAGTIAGRAARGFAGGIGMTPFVGAQGLAQAISSIPGVGGALAAPLSASLSMGGMAVTNMRDQLEMMPFLGNLGSRSGQNFRIQKTLTEQGLSSEQIAAEVEKARATAAGQVQLTKREEAFAQHAAKRMFEVRARVHGEDAARQKGSDLNLREEIGIRASLNTPELRARFLEAGRETVLGNKRTEAGSRAAQQAKERLEKAAAEVTERVIEAGVTPLERAGRDLAGMDVMAARQFAGQVVQRGGGTGQDLQQQGMLRAAFAAKTAFGVGADVSGAFLQAGRRGGMVGIESGGNALVDAIRGAMQQGLEGSEITTYLEQVADGIQAWKTTGIPINAKSLSGLGAGMAGMGLGSIRGSSVAQGITTAAQQLSTRGPQSASELLMLQALGGFQGGGVADFEKAQLRLEAGEFSDKDVQNLMRRFTQAGGGGETGRQTLRAALGDLGVSVSASEAVLLDKQLNGGQLSPEELRSVQNIQNQLRRGRSQAPRNLAALEGRAAGAVDPELKKQAGITNQQIATGTGMIDTMLNLEKSTTNVAQAFEKVADPIKTLTTQIQTLTEVMPRLITTMKAGSDLSGLSLGNP